MDDSSKKPKQIKQAKRINHIVEPALSLVVDRANELRVTKDEFMSLSPLPHGFVLLYYR